MTKFIEDDFSKELSELFTKYNKSIQSDKNGIYIVENINAVKIVLFKPTTGSEDSRTKLYFIY